jgi:hypothetical protein
VFYTYAHYTPENRLFYIGKGCGRRAYTTDKRNAHWKNIVAKYGKPRVEILANWNTEAEAHSHEILLISCFKDMGYKLANLTNGGEGISGYKFSEESKEKIRIFHTGKAWCKGRKHTEEEKRKIGVKSKGNKYSLGFIQSVEHREKNSQLQMNNTRALGYKHVEAFKEKISEGLKGNKNACGGFKWIGTHQKTKEIITFLTTTELNKAGFQHANVIKCINGKRKSHKGYTWTKELLENKL